jgi:glycosyltransferase involved in cell wall biosynthesis
MKILLSAYACEPDKGSEPAVGWVWAIELARSGHDVWIITRSNNQQAIERALRDSPEPRCHFVYYDLPRFITRWKRRSWLQAYYVAWQWGAFLLARRLHQSIDFDRVHHVTFVSIRLPSFMGLLRIPFVFGPVAGGEAAPFALRRSYRWSGWVRDLARDMLNLWVRIDPLLNLTFSTAMRVFVTSAQTAQLVPARFREKTDIQLAIGLEERWYLATREPMHRPKTLRVLYVGNLLYLKGMHLGLKAFDVARRTLDNVSLTIVGNGPDRALLDRESKHLGLERHITWISQLPRTDLPKIYGVHDVLLFPSLHDSGGMVVLEALAAGLPVVCLDIGGPGVIVNNCCGKAVSTKGRSELQVVTEMSTALIVFGRDRLALAQASRQAQMRAAEFRWADVVSNICRRLKAAQIERC